MNEQAWQLTGTMTDACARGRRGLGTRKERGCNCTPGTRPAAGMARMEETAGNAALFITI